MRLLCECLRPSQVHNNRKAASLAKCDRHGVGREQARQVVERTNELLDEVERLRAEWERSREIIESAKQMRIAADGYISTLEEANKALAECVNGALEEMERLQKVNKEIARAAEVMAQISKTLE